MDELARRAAATARAAVQSTASLFRLNAQGSLLSWTVVGLPLAEISFAAQSHREGGFATARP
jgi:hypothetical protein